MYAVPYYVSFPSLTLSQGCLCHSPRRPPSPSQPPGHQHRPRECFPRELHRQRRPCASSHWEIRHPPISWCCEAILQRSCRCCEHPWSVYILSGAALLPSSSGARFTRLPLPILPISLSPIPSIVPNTRQASPVSMAPTSFPQPPPHPSPSNPPSSPSAMPSCPTQRAWPGLSQPAPLQTSVSSSLHFQISSTTSQA